MRNAHIRTYMVEKAMHTTHALTNCSSTVHAHVTLDICRLYRTYVHAT